MSMAAAAVAEDIIRTSALAIPGLPLLIRDPSMDGPEADEACRKRTSDDRRRRRRRVHPHPQPPNKNELHRDNVCIEHVRTYLSRSKLAKIARTLSP
jgi:hypothetical protein